MIKNAIRLETTYSQVTDKTEKDRLTSLKPAEAHSQFINNSQCDHTSTSQQAKGVPIRTHYCVNVATQPFSRFFILIWFAAVKLLLLVITTPPTFNSPLALTQGLTSGKFHTQAKVFKNSENSCHF